MALEYVEYPVLPIVKVHLIINSIVVFIAVLVVGLRIASRFLSGAKLWWDDYLILLALPQGIGMLVIQGLWAPMGVGVQMSPSFPLTNLLYILKLLLSYQLIFTVAITTIKLSVMLFYMRVFVNHGLRLATKIAMGFVLLWGLGAVLQVFLICRPFAATYDPRIPGVCGSQVASFIATGSFNVVTDILILGLPIPTVWSLKMSVRAKLGLTGVFMIGLLVSVVSVIRIVTLTQLDLVGNLTGTMVWPDFWSPLEINLAIICVSMPMLGAMFKRCAARRSSSKLDVSSNSTNGFTSGGSKFSKLKNGNYGVDGYDLETIYAPNIEVHHQSAAVTTSNGIGRSGEHGSDVALSPEPIPFPSDQEGIKVQTKWAVSRELD